MWGCGGYGVGGMWGAVRNGRLWCNGASPPSDLCPLTFDPQLTPMPWEEVEALKEGGNSTQVGGAGGRGRGYGGGGAAGCLRLEGQRFLVSSRGDASGWAHGWVV